MLVTKTRTEVIPIYGGNWGYGYNNRTHAILTPNFPGLPPVGGFINGSFGAGLPVPNYQMTSEETITYDNKGFNHPNPCSHRATKRNCFKASDVVSNSVPQWDYAWASTWPWVADITHNYQIMWVPNIPGQLGQFQAIGPHLDASQLLTQKVAELEAGLVDEVFNWPRALIELKDVPKTVRGIFQILSSLRNIYSLGGNSLLNQFGGADQRLAFAFASKAGRDTFGSPTGIGRKFNPRDAAKLLSASKGSLGDVASAYLTYQFGIRPTVKDVREFLGLKWSKDHGRTTSLEFAVQHIAYRKGQKLRRPFNLGPRREDFPKVYAAQAELITPLLRDSHTQFQGEPWIKARMQAVPACIAETIRGVAFGEVMFDKEVDIPYSERLAYSGGLISTLYEVTPWTFVLDWVCDVGAALRNFERATFPVEYRPVLKHGPWISLGKSQTVYIPVFKNVRHNVEMSTVPDPNSGYGGAVFEHVGIGEPTWVPAFEYSLEYDRYPAVSAMSTFKPPPLRAPGRYSYGPAAALFASYATGHSATFRR